MSTWELPGEHDIRILLAWQPEGGYVVTSPDIPGLVTEGDEVGEALENACDALAALQEAPEFFILMDDTEAVQVLLTMDESTRRRVCAAEITVCLSLEVARKLRTVAAIQGKKPHETAATAIRDYVEAFHT